VPAPTSIVSPLLAAARAGAICVYGQPLGQTFRIAASARLTLSAAAIASAEASTATLRRRRSHSAATARVLAGGIEHVIVTPFVGAPIGPLASTLVGLVKAQPDRHIADCGAGQRIRACRQRVFSARDGRVVNCDDRYGAVVEVGHVQGVGRQLERRPVRPAAGDDLRRHVRAAGEHRGVAGGTRVAAAGASRNAPDVEAAAVPAEIANEAARSVGCGSRTAAIGLVPPSGDR
jgi:hypothetical protein